MLHCGAMHLVGVGHRSRNHSDAESTTILSVCHRGHAVCYVQVRRHKVVQMGSARARAMKAAHEAKLKRQEEVAREAEHHKALQLSLAHQRAQDLDKKRFIAYQRQ